MPRVSIDLDQDILEVAQRVARDRGLTLSEAVSWLARNGVAASGTAKMNTGVRMFTPAQAGMESRPRLSLVARR